MGAFESEPVSGSNRNGRIARVDPFTVSIPFTAPESSATLSRIGFDNVILRLETNEGCVGWGEISGGSGAPVETVRALFEVIRPIILGASVFDTEALRAAIISRGRLANLRRLAHLVTSGIDMACWDAAGKLTGKPVHALFGGGVREHVDFYAYPLAKDPNEVATHAAEMVGRGFSVVYLKVGMGDARDLETVRQTRVAVGPGPRIRVDANEAWDVATTRRMSVAMEPYQIDFIEQPIDARDLIGMRELRKATRTPIAANQGIWSPAEALQAIRLEACDVVVTGPFWVGGLLPLQRIGALCAENGIGLCLHAPPATSIGTAAGLQALATVPTLLDGNQTYLYYLAEDVSESLGDRHAAKLAIPDGPGLGITIDETRLREMTRRYEKNGSFMQTAGASS